MRLGNNAVHYGGVAMVLHWLVALAIFANVALAFYFNDLLDHHDPARLWLVQTHKSIGLSVLVLSAARLAWRLVNPIPTMPAEMGPGMKRLARASHCSLYILMMVVPLLGWGLASASRTNVPTYFFGAFAWPNIGLIADMTRDNKKFYGHWIGTAHECLGYAMLFLALGHISAALYHHFVRRDLVLKRMLPGISL